MDGLKGCLAEILLAQMHTKGAVGNGLLPVIIDKDPRLILAPERDGANDRLLGARTGLYFPLETQLNGAAACLE
ncbi:MAG: hypothetical protein SAqBPW_02710 [Shewanella algae]